MTDECVMNTNLKERCRTYVRIFVNGPMGAGKTTLMKELFKAEEFTRRVTLGYDSYDREWDINWLYLKDMDSLYTSQDFQILKNEDEFEKNHIRILNERIQQFEATLNSEVKLIVYFGLIQFNYQFFFGSFHQKYMLLPPFHTVATFYYHRQSKKFYNGDIFSGWVNKPQPNSLTNISVLSLDDLLEHYADLKRLGFFDYTIVSDHKLLRQQLINSILSYK